MNIWKASLFSRSYIDQVYFKSKYRPSCSEIIIKDFSMFGARRSKRFRILMKIIREGFVLTVKIARS
uniref:Uncharacterized protein n=1 Tax=Kalanchoe fedtschenkoi TaxID=63787 RepID=A0A7N1A7Z0_KALFE